MTLSMLAAAAVLVGTTVSVAADSRAADPPVASESVAQLRVRVATQSGTPIRDAEAAVRRLEKTDLANVDENEPKSSLVESDGARWFKTDAAGVCQIPAKLPAGTSCVVEVRAAGFVPAASVWLRTDGRQVISVPDVVLRRLRTISGIVLDRQGRAVEGATVFQSGDGPVRTECKSDRTGRFQISGVPEGQAFLFVEKSGFWFTGRLINTSDRSQDEVIELVLAARDGPNPQQFQPLAPVLPAPTREQREQALKAIVVQTQKALADGTDQEKFQQLNTLAAMDPGAALDQVNQAQFPSEQYRQAAQMIVVQQLARTSPDEAVALLPNFADPMARINSLLNLWDHIPDTERVLQRKLLDEALLSTRTDLNLTNQGWAVRQVAVRLKQLGEPADRIRDVLQQATDRVNQVADPQATKAAHGHLALAWALIDSKAALAQSAKADPSFKYSLAQALAVRDPAASERLCADLVASPDGASGTKLWHNVPRVCYRMARVDLDRAKRIADLADLSSREFRRYAVIHSAEPVAGQEKLENVGPVHLKALTYAWMADAVRDTHPAEARQLFQNAVDLLTPLREAIMFDSSGFMHTPSLILVSLFPIAERVHPELIPELFWRALALRLPADSTEDADRISHDISLSLLAGMLARYDRTVARAVIEPVAERERSRSHVGVSAGVWTGLVSTQIDPTWAIAWAESLSDQPLDSLVFGTTQSPRERVLSGIRYRLATEPDTRRAPHVLHAGAWPTVMSVLWMDEFTDPDRRLER